MSNSGKFKLEGTGRSCCSIISYKSWLHCHPKLKSKSMIHKILRQSDLYHNLDTLYQPVGKINESTVLVEGQKARALTDSHSQLSSVSLAWVKN